MSDPTTTTIVSPDYSRSFFGHPRGLATLFMTEFCERFTYYGMRAMLVLFLGGRRRRPRIRASASTARPPARSTALFTGGAYLLAMPGGWIADRLIGQRNAPCSSAAC